MASQTPPTRLREAELIRLLQVDQTSPTLAALLELVALQEQQAVEALVSCPLEVFPGLQGKAQALRHLRSKLTEKPHVLREI